MSALPEHEPSWKLPHDVKTQLLQAIADMLDRAPAGLRMSFDEFMHWTNEDTHAEWVDGKVLMPSPVSLDHQRIADFLARIMDAFVTMRQLGLVVTTFMMKITRAGREPDVLFVAEAHRNRVKPTFVDGPADLVVEIISPESVGRDRGEKFFEYEQAGIPEYWLIDPRTRRAEFYRLDDQGKYHLFEADAQGIYRSLILRDFWINVSWLWQTPAPEVALLEICGQEYADMLLRRMRQQGFTMTEDDK